MSVADIKNEYYPFWKEQVIKKKGNDVDLSFERCLDDWIATNWAINVTEEVEFKIKLLEDEPFKMNKDNLIEGEEIERWLTDIAKQTRPE